MTSPNDSVARTLYAVEFIDGSIKIGITGSMWTRILHLQFSLGDAINCCVAGYGFNVTTKCESAALSRCKHISGVIQVSKERFRNISFAEACEIVCDSTTGPLYEHPVMGSGRGTYKRGTSRNHWARSPLREAMFSPAAIEAKPAAEAA